MTRKKDVPKDNIVGKGRQMKPRVLHQIVSALCAGIDPKQVEVDFQLQRGYASRCLVKIQDLNLDSKSVAEMPAEELHKLYYSRKPRIEVKSNYISPNFAKIQEQVEKEQSLKTSPVRDKKLKLTHALIHERFYLEDPENVALNKKTGRQFLSYTRFNELYLSWLKVRQLPVYAKQHVPGQELEIDFSGPKIRYKDGGVEKDATIFVAVLPFSGLIYAEAIPNQEQENVVKALINCFKFIGGVPTIVRVDNFKGAVNKPALYGGIVNSDFDKVASFFGCSIVTCRSYKPKDKGCVESCVRAVSMRVLAFCESVNRSKVLRNQGVFENLGALNRVIRKRLDKLNNKRPRTYGRTGTRIEVFKSQESSALSAPPCWEYSPGQISRLTVPDSARIQHEQHFYALDHKWRGKEVDMTITSDRILFTSGRYCIATYERKDNVPGVSAYPNFILEKHMIVDIFMLPQQKAYLMAWASRIGKYVLKVCSEIFDKFQGSIEAARYVTAILKLPKANMNLYPQLEEITMKWYESSSRPDINSATTKICNLWQERTDKQVELKMDEFFSFNAYVKCGKNIIEGKAFGFVCPHNTLPSELSSCSVQQAKGEILNVGLSEKLAQKYHKANIAASAQPSEDNSPQEENN